VGDADSTAGLRRRLVSCYVIRKRCESRDSASLGRQPEVERYGRIQRFGGASTAGLRWWLVAPM